MKAGVGLKFEVLSRGPALPGPPTDNGDGLRLNRMFCHDKVKTALKEKHV